MTVTTIKTPLELVVGYLEDTLTPSKDFQLECILYKDIDTQWEFPYHPKFGWIVLWNSLDEFLEIYWYVFYVKNILPQIERIDPELVTYIHVYGYIEDVLKQREDNSVCILCKQLREWVVRKCADLPLSKEEREALEDKLLALAIEANDVFIYEEV